MEADESSLLSISDPNFDVNPVVPDIFNKPGLPGGANLPHLLFCFVFTAARSADVLFQTKLSID